MRSNITSWFKPRRSSGLDKRLKRLLHIHKDHMSYPPYSKDTQKRVMGEIDVVRYGTIALAMHRLDRENIPGDMAELGVFRGRLTRFLVTMKGHRHLHLFDTFEGFADEDLEGEEKDDSRFRATSVDFVRSRLETDENVSFHVGRFPETGHWMTDEHFAFTMLDFDKYQPTKAALECFYDRMSPGGYIFLHDFNNPESNYAVKRATEEFMADKPEEILEIPDACGSAFFRKIRA